MTKKQQKESSQSNLFQESLKGIKPLKNDRIDLYAHPKNTRPFKDKSDYTADNTSHTLSDQQKTHNVSGEEFIFFAHMGLQLKTQKHLRQGKIPIDDHLDLHGLSINEARELLVEFIDFAQKQNLTTKVHILSPEFDEGLVRSLDRFDFPPEFDSIKHIISAISQDLYYEDEQFKIEILLGDARKSIPKIKEQIDIIYQDAFSPAHNPLLWTKEHFAELRAISNDDTILTTYSTAAAIRLGLYENGFYIFIHRAQMMRYSTVASLVMLEELEYIDMELKKIRNTEARSMRDENYL